MPAIQETSRMPRNGIIGLRYKTLAKSIKSLLGVDLRGQSDRQATGKRVDWEVVGNHSGILEGAVHHG